MIIPIRNVFSNRNNRIFWFFLLSIVIASGCNQQPDSPAENTGDKVPEFLVIFGSGGGFSGMWTGYGINDSGVVFTWQGIAPDSADFQKQFHLPEPDFRRLDSLSAVAPPPLNDPGNFSFLIQFKEQDPVIWNSQSTDGVNLSAWFETLTTIVENNRRQP